MEIQIKEQENKGFALARIEGKRVGIMTYSIPQSNFIIIDHTEVDRQHQGKQIGKKLLHKIVEMSRKKHLKIFPLCPFAKKMFERDTNLHDVLKR